MRTQTRNLVESAIMIALATVLSTIQYSMPLGGGITLLSMVPIILISYKLGVKWGLASGFVYSIIQLILGWSTVGYIFAAGITKISLCILLDYILPFTCLGLAGAIRYNKNQYVGIALGTAAVIILRFIFHTVSGAVIWYEITKAENWNDIVHQYSMWVYSIIYNGSYMGIEFISHVIATPVIAKLLSKKIKYNM